MSTAISKDWLPKNIDEIVGYLNSHAMLMESDSGVRQDILGIVRLLEAQSDSLARMTTARDCLSEELKRIEAAIDAAGGDKFERNCSFIARQKADRDVLIAALVEAKSFVGALDKFIGNESTTGRVIRLALEKVQAAR